jgi:hypothetical protein
MLAFHWAFYCGPIVPLYSHTKLIANLLGRYWLAS